jgi:hypothetical protein
MSPRWHGVSPSGVRFLPKYEEPLAHSFNPDVIKSETDCPQSVKIVTSSGNVYVLCTELLISVYNTYKEAVTFENLGKTVPSTFSIPVAFYAYRKLSQSKELFSPHEKIVLYEELYSFTQEKNTSSVKSKKGFISNVKRFFSFFSIV